MNVTEADRFNVTYAGTCCGVVMAISGLGCDSLVRSNGVTTTLGEPIEDTAPCMLCGKPVALRVVGLCIAPYVAQQDDEDDSDAQFADEWDGDEDES